MGSIMATLKDPIEYMGAIDMKNNKVFVVAWSLEGT